MKGDESPKYLAKKLERRFWRKAFETSFETCGGASLLRVLRLRVGRRAGWELTADHGAVREDVADARTGYLGAYRAAKSRAADNDPAGATQRATLRDYLNGEQKLVHLIFDKLTIPVDLEATKAEGEMPIEVSGALLLDAMGVESAVYSGSVVATRTRANAIRELCDEALEKLYMDEIKADKSSEGIRNLLREVLLVHRVYYGSIAQVAEALKQAATADPAAISSLDHALETLIHAQRHLGADVYASELPAYGVALKAWRYRLEPGSAPPVRLD